MGEHDTITTITVNLSVAYESYTSGFILLSYIYNDTKYQIILPLPCVLTKLRWLRKLIVILNISTI